MEMHEYDLPNGKLCFDPKKHRYIYEGEVIPGCTTLVKGLSPTEILMAWAAKMTAEHIAEHIEGINPLDPVAMQELCREAKGQFRKKRDKLADVGTHVHAYAEGFMKAKHWGTEYPKLPVNDQAAKACRGFVEWQDSHDIQIHALEQKVLNTGSHGVWPYAGTFDCDMTIDGMRTLADWKTSARINPEMGAQLGGYDLAMEEMFPDVTYDQHMIVRFDRDTGEVDVWQTKSAEEVHLDRYAFLASYRLWAFAKQWGKG